MKKRQLFNKTYLQILVKLQMFLTMHSVLLYFCNTVEQSVVCILFNFTSCVLLAIMLLSSGYPSSCSVIECTKLYKCSCLFWQEVIS